MTQNHSSRYDQDEHPKPKERIKDIYNRSARPTPQNKKEKKLQHFLFFIFIWF